MKVDVVLCKKEVMHHAPLRRGARHGKKYCSDPIVYEIPVRVREETEEVSELDMDAIIGEVCDTVEEVIDENAAEEAIEDMAEDAAEEAEELNEEIEVTEGMEDIISQPDEDEEYDEEEAELLALIAEEEAEMRRKAEAEGDSGEQ